MLGLIYKDAICLKKNLKMFVAVGFGVMLMAVMFALSCKMGNISEGLSNYDSIDTMGKELLVAVIDIVMHMVLIIPMAFIANIVDCFTEDYKSGFYSKLLAMPLKYSEIVGFNPLRRGIGPARLAAGNTKSDLLACGNPRLGVGVEKIPAELTLLRLDLTPRNAHINDARAREPIERITGIGTRTITP